MQEKINNLERRIKELETEFQELAKLSSSIHMTQRLEDIVSQMDKILEDNDILKQKIGKLIDNRVEEKTEIGVNEMRESWEKSGFSIQQIAERFDITVDYVQKLIDGESDNVSLKKRLLAFLIKKQLVSV